MAAQPLVSIVIPVYNGSDYVGPAIESALGQDYPNVEVIVVNDGSSDDGRSAAVVRRYAPRIRYFEKPNGGVATALNLGIREMRGEYLSWLSHDDLYRPEKISRQVDRMAEAGDGAILYSDFEAIDENGAHLADVRMPPADAANFRYELTQQNFIHGCTLLIPRACLQATGAFAEELRTTQDYDLWFRLAERYRFVHMPEILVCARQHAGQGTRRMHDTALRECNELLAGFVMRLTDEELRRGSGRSAMGGYVELARSFRERRFRGALKVAVSKAIRAARSESFASALSETLRLARVLAVDPAAALPRRLVSGLARRLR